jgi:transcriptional regulator with XRE-family HTH domain
LGVILVAVSEIERVEELTLSQRLGLRVRELRLERGLTQVQLAEVLGVHDSVLSKIEKRSQAPLTVSTLEQVAWALDADLVIELRPRAVGAG